MPTARPRREPPRFRHVAVRRVEPVRPLLPAPGEQGIVTPTWNGNEFLLPDGRRPTIRTFTPRRADPRAGELDVEIVVHGEGAASQWAPTAADGDEAAVS